MTDLLQPHASDQEADRRAREWLDELDHQSAVGNRHHVVPKFLLSRFASPHSQLRVRDRAKGVPSLRAIGDLAIRDFYTVVTNARELDSSLESLLSVVEGETATILRQHLDLRAFARPRPFTPEERATIDMFVAMQHVRGLRARRMIEMLTDYTVKLLNQDKLSDKDIKELDFVPHPNEHLRMFASLSERLESSLASRPLSIVRLDRPLLITGDEPVVSLHEPAEPLQQTALVREPQERVHLEGHGGGIANAAAILLAVAPDAALVYGPVGETGQAFECTLQPQDAASFAAEHNDLIAAGSVDWVAANLGHETFSSMRMPAPIPLLAVHDGGSAIAARINTTTVRRPIRRLRSDDVSIISQE